MQFNKNGVSKEAEQLGRGQRKKKPTMKGIEYKTSLMKERRHKVYARVIRKYAAIEILFCSSRNVTAVQEEMCQKTLKYWVGVQRGQSYLTGRRCLFSLG